MPGLKGRIDPPNELGMALCVYGDAGWGRDVQRGREVDGRFDRELIVGAAKAIRDRWHPVPWPEWVAAVPSVRRPGLVDGFARALARELDLPFVDCLRAAADAEPQEGMLNSVRQLANAHRTLALDGSVAIPAGPVLLVDDLVDSGWTLTVAGWLLREGGSGPVHPFALAASSGRE